eukprot:11595824-Alexandrium_andersonii.AAC.1
MLLKFREAMARVFDAGVEGTKAACEKARHEGDLQQSLGATVHGVLGRACAILVGESAQLAELRLSPMTVLSTAQTIGVPHGSDAVLREMSITAAPWHSVVIGDSALAFIDAKSSPEYPSYKYALPIALGALWKQPSIFVESGACLRKLARCVNEAFAGTAKGYDEGRNPAHS